MNAVCYECNAGRHAHCRRPSCECHCQWASNKAEVRLLVTCWCEDHTFNLPAEMVRSGQTVSCGQGCG